MGVTSRTKWRMVTANMILALVLVIGVLGAEARHRSSNRKVSGSCPTETGKECVFPFKTVCTTGKGPCIFPFLYKGKEYNECTLYHANGGKAWCATSLKADGNMHQWSNCYMDSCSPDLDGGPYTGCIPSATQEGKEWCATTVGDDGFFTQSDFCTECTPPTTTTTTSTSTTVSTTTKTTTSTTATTTEDSDCGWDIPTECITGFSGSVYNTTEDFLGVADFFVRVRNVIEKGVTNLINFVLPWIPTGGEYESATTGVQGTTAAGTTAGPAGTTAAPAGTTGAASNRKGLFHDQVQDLIASGERTDCRVLANQITGGAFDNALGMIGLRNLAILKDNVQEASNRGILDKITEFIAKAGVVIPEECVCECGCQKIPTKPEAVITTETPVRMENKF